MGEQRNRPKMNYPEELDEMEASNLFDRELRVMIIRILNSMAKDIETINKDQSEINNTLEGINSRLDEAENKISDL